MGNFFREFPRKIDEIQISESIATFQTNKILMCIVDNFSCEIAVLIDCGNMFETECFTRLKVLAWPE